MQRLLLIFKYKRKSCEKASCKRILSSPSWQTSSLYTPFAEFRQFQCNAKNELKCSQISQHIFSSILHFPSLALDMIHSTVCKISRYHDSRLELCTTSNNGASNFQSRVRTASYFERWEKITSQNWSESKKKELFTFQVSFCANREVECDWNSELQTSDSLPAGEMAQKQFFPLWLFLFCQSEQNVAELSEKALEDESFVIYTDGNLRLFSRVFLARILRKKISSRKFDLNEQSEIECNNSLEGLRGWLYKSGMLAKLSSKKKMMRSAWKAVVKRVMASCKDLATTSIFEESSHSIVIATITRNKHGLR